MLSKMKRMLSLLLSAILLVLPALAFSGCCAKEENENSSYSKETTEYYTQQEEEQTPFDNISFDGEVFPITMPLSATDEFCRDSQRTSLSEGLLARATAVEKKLDIRLQADPINSGGNALAIRFLNDPPQGITVLPNIAAELAVNGYFHNLNALERVDVDNPWYNRAFMQATDVNGYCPFAAGEMTPSLWENATVVLANANLLAAGEIADLADAVVGGKWTYELLMQIATRHCCEINGKAVFGLGNSSGSVPAMLVSGGFRLVRREPGAGMQFAGFGDETAHSVYRTLRKLWSTPELMPGLHAGGEAVFADAGEVFLITRLSCAEGTVGAAGISLQYLPVPKQTEEDTVYRTTPDRWSMLTVPYNLKSDRLWRTSTVLEALGYYSEKVGLREQSLAFFLNLAGTENISDRTLPLCLADTAFSFGQVYNEALGRPLSVVADLLITENDRTAANRIGMNASVYSNKLSVLCDKLSRYPNRPLTESNG